MESVVNEGKVVIITGASSGIGRAVARLAASKGYRLALNARREDRLREVASRIQADGGEAIVVPGDIALAEVQQRLVEETANHFGRIDVLVNNAGFPLPSGFIASEPEDLRRQWDVNVTTLATLTRLALPYLEKNRGVVVNIGSILGHFPVPGMGNYAPTKIAVAALTRALRLELGARGVRVCLVEPGPVATEFNERAGGERSRPSMFNPSAARAAVPIVRLFEHPRSRVSIPGWMGPLGSVGGVLVRLLSPLIARIALSRSSPPA
jgi:uncharacterized protein